MLFISVPMFDTPILWYTRDFVYKTKDLHSRTIQILDKTYVSVYISWKEAGDCNSLIEYKGNVKCSNNQFLSVGSTKLIHEIWLFSWVFIQQSILYIRDYIFDFFLSINFNQNDKIFNFTVNIYTETYVLSRICIVLLCKSLVL